jgi:hypothetical protein
VWTEVFFTRVDVFTALYFKSISMGYSFTVTQVLKVSPQQLAFTITANITI